jgi:hypothetical protein
MKKTIHNWQGMIQKDVIYSRSVFRRMVDPWQGSTDQNKAVFTERTLLFYSEPNPSTQVRIALVGRGEYEIESTEETNGAGGEEKDEEFTLLDQEALLSGSGTYPSVDVYTDEDGRFEGYFLQTYS